MEIINISDYKEIRFSTAIVLGNFDGLHLGHQELIKTMVKRSKELGLVPSLFLFSQHTKNVTEKNGPKMITANEQKIRLAKELGVEIAYILEFNEDVMKLSGEEFIRDIIINKLNGKLIVVGFDYKFGYKASGDASYLIELGSKYDIDIIIVNPIEQGDMVISSSDIRKLISSGEIIRVTELMGRPYSILGKVINGSNRGNKLGFPTANIELLENYILPKNGVYATNTIVNNKKYLSATNIGNNPTFEENHLKIETFILDFNDNIYGEIIEIEFLDFIRDDLKFHNVDDLIVQMESDINLIRNKY